VHDPLSPDPDKQTTVAVNYLLTEYVAISYYDIRGSVLMLLNSTGWAKLNDTNLVFDVVIENILNNCDDFWQFK